MNTWQLIVKAVNVDILKTRIKHAFSVLSSQGPHILANQDMGSSPGSNHPNPEMTRFDTGLEDTKGSQWEGTQTPVLGA